MTSSQIGRIGTLLFSLAVLLQEGNGQYFVDPSVPFVKSFEGWGTSLCWWPDVLGAMPEDVIQRVVQDVFSADGLNLNIVRYTIGGTTPGDLPCGAFRPGGATETFKDGPDRPYDWTRDPRQRRILFMAKELGVDTFEAFSNTPPHWMTLTGCSKGNAEGGRLHANFNSSEAPAFANYIADVLEYYRDVWDIEFQTYAPFNEPYGLMGDGYWSGAEKLQEGCSMDEPTMVETIKEFRKTFDARRITTELTISDETQVDTAVYIMNTFTAENVTKLAGKINVHGYSDIPAARRDILYSNTMKAGLRLWMDEMGWSSTPVGNMGQALNIAQRIVKDLRELCPSAWVYWQVMEDAGAWGLVSIPYNNASLANVVLESGFYSFGQFTKYIPKGFDIININDGNAIAAFSQQANKLVLVIVNPGTGSEDREYSLELFSSIGNISAIRTSAAETQQDVSNQVRYLPTLKRVVVPMVPTSVITVIIENVVAATSTSLVQDGDFEGQSAAWTTTGDAEVSAENSWLGTYSGMVRNGSISQSFRITTGGALFLSARCASSTSGSETTLSLSVNGEERSVAIDRVQYVSYGLAHRANAGDVVTVRFSASNVAWIDSVYVHRPSVA